MTRNGGNDNAVKRRHVFPAVITITDAGMNSVITGPLEVFRSLFAQLFNNLDGVYVVGKFSKYGRLIPRPGADFQNPTGRLMPAEVGLRVYQKHQAFYDRLQASVAKAAGKAGIADPDAVLSTLSVQSGRLTAITKKFRAAALLISGCQDNQTSLDGDHNGAFTGRLREVWNNGKFAGNYAQFHATIKAGMPASQTPNLYLIGDAAAFVAQTPFTV